MRLQEMSCMDCIIINQEDECDKEQSGKVLGIYEEKIAAFLKQNGFMILERNYRCKQGEIDIIAKDGKYFVFIEVKFRASSGSAFFRCDHRSPERPCGSGMQRCIICFPINFRRKLRAGLMRRGSMKRSHIRNAFNEIAIMK